MELKEYHIKDLKPNPKNPRKITQNELKKLIRSIKEFGFIDPVIINKNKERENIIIGGHQRVEAVKKLMNNLDERIEELKKEVKQEKEDQKKEEKNKILESLIKVNQGIVPVIETNLPEEKENILNIALNEISGDWDEEKLRNLLKELDQKPIDLTLTGFEEAIIDKIINSEQKINKELIDVVPEPPKKPKTKPGELWILGEHKVMCGDSTKEEDMKKLIGEEKADLCWTDPPYGVSYRGTNNPNGREWGVMMNDELREKELKIFLTKAFKNIYRATKDNTALYSCYAIVNHIIFEQALNEAGYEIKQVLIWEKGHILGHSDYHWSHEPILYCKKKDQKTTWYGDRTQKTTILQKNIKELEEMKKEELIELIKKIKEDSDLISIKKDPATEYLHSTQKPVDLPMRMIKNSSRPLQIVLDPFGGSGSTLIACELSKRKARIMELDPKYADVIITRWKNITGKEPVREDGKKWSEI